MKNKMYKSIFIKLSFLSFIFMPSIVFAAPPKDLGAFIDIITGIIGNSVVPLIFTLAFAFFIWGVVQYVLNDGDEGKKEKGKQFMIWGIIGLTVMFAVFGLVKILAGTFGIDVSFIPKLPE